MEQPSQDGYLEVRDSSLQLNGINHMLRKIGKTHKLLFFLLLLAPKTIVALSNCLENYFVKVSRNTLFVSNYGTRASKLRGENVSYVGTIAHLLFALSTSETNERPSQPRQNSQNMNTDEMVLSTSPRLPTIHPPLGLDIGKQGWLQIWY